MSGKKGWTFRFPGVPGGREGEGGCLVLWGQGRRPDSPLWRGGGGQVASGRAGSLPLEGGKSSRSPISVLGHRPAGGRVGGRGLMTT